jgi:hypothetical protein
MITSKTSSRLHVFCAALIGSLLFTMSSCSTDIALNAPYKKTPVVFGLLDAKQDTQWVRVNRTWLGEGNQFDAAMIADSSEYPAEDLTVEITERIGGQMREWSLIDTMIGNKLEDGIFFGPNQQMWYFIPEGGLNTDAEYDLKIAIEGEEDDVTATTNMIAEQIGNISQPPPGVTNFKIGFASVGFQTTFPDLTFKWSSTAGASRYDAIMLIHVTERTWNDEAHTDLLSEEERIIQWPIGTLNTQDDDGGDILQKEVSGERFFTTLATQLEPDAFVTRVLGVWDDEVQIARVVDFELTVANDELSTYLEITSPVTGVIQERPEYTNISWGSDHDGLGLFAARSTQGVYGIGCTTASLAYLIEGADTYELNFCTPNPFSDFYCD